MNRSAKIAFWHVNSPKRGILHQSMTVRGNQSYVAQGWHKELPQLLKQSRNWGWNRQRSIKDGDFLNLAWILQCPCQTIRPYKKSLEREHNKCKHKLQVNHIIQKWDQHTHPNLNNEKERRLDLQRVQQFIKGLMVLFLWQRFLNLLENNEPCLLDYEW